ncbi:unnamed protein product [Closterium sp. Naga37s-1]|nr:unnamed protein product [Closterium sp. Naga37s-1]
MAGALQFALSLPSGAPAGMGKVGAQGRELLVRTRHMALAEKPAKMAGALQFALSLPSGAPAGMGKVGAQGRELLVRTRHMALAEKPAKMAGALQFALRCACWNGEGGGAREGAAG